MPALSVGDVTQVEGSNNGWTKFKFPVTLSSAGTQRVKVHYDVLLGTAQADDVRVLKGHIASIRPGKLSTSITVRVRGDKVGESDETFFVALSLPENATIADGQGVGTIVDDDGGGPAALPALSISDASGLEGDSGTSNLSFVVSLSAPAPAGGTTFTLTTADDTASAPSDFTSSTVAGSIAAGGHAVRLRRAGRR